MNETRNKNEIFIREVKPFLVQALNAAQRHGISTIFSAAIPEPGNPRQMVTLHTPDESGMTPESILRIMEFTMAAIDPVEPVQVNGEMVKVGITDSLADIPDEVKKVITAALNGDPLPDDMMDVTVESVSVASLGGEIPPEVLERLRTVFPKAKFTLTDIEDMAPGRTPGQTRN